MKYLVLFLYLRVSLAVVAVASSADDENPAPLADSQAAELSAEGLEKVYPNNFIFSVYSRPWSRFSPGDTILIRVIRGNSRGTQAGGLFAVMGSYTLSSMDHAILGLFETVRTYGSTPVFHSQWARISKGSGTFLLWYQMRSDGAPHVSFYPPGSGEEARGGVYFKVEYYFPLVTRPAPNRPAIPEPVFRLYLPPEGRVKIGKPIFRNFIDGGPSH